MNCQLESKVIVCDCGTKICEPVRDSPTTCPNCKAEWKKSTGGWAAGEIYRSK